MTTKKIIIGASILFAIWLIWYLFFNKTKVQKVAASVANRDCNKANQNLRDMRRMIAEIEDSGDEEIMSGLISDINSDPIFITLGWSYGNPMNMDSVQKIQALNKFLTDFEKAKDDICKA